MANTTQDITPISLGSLLSWVVLVCGIGLLFLGISSSWKGNQGLLAPSSEQLRQVSGRLQRLTFHQPNKAPSVVDVVVYSKGEGLKYGYLNYGLQSWEERLKPFQNKEIIMDVAANHQIWGVEAAGKTIIRTSEIETVFLGYKKRQQTFAAQMDYVGLGLILFWLFFLRKKYC